MNTHLLFATTDEGVELPVIDITNPAFAVIFSEAELSAMAEQHAREAAREIPPHVLDALRQSILGRALMAASGTFLGGLETYRLKLGPDLLGADATPIDRQIAASFPAQTARLRLHDMARLLVDGLGLAGFDEPRRPICMVNIGGGPAADSWNALIRLHRERPELLPQRPLTISVLDLDDRGPAFGARAVEALRAPAAPLAGLDISFRHISFNWSDADRLQDTLGELRAADSACAVSSEGALFDYGSDSEIVSNLKAIHAATAMDAFVVGTVTRPGVMARSSPIATRPRTIEAFGSLAGQAGWMVQHAIDRPFSYHVRMVKAAASIR